VIGVSNPQGPILQTKPSETQSGYRPSYSNATYNAVNANFRLTHYEPEGKKRGGKDYQRSASQPVPVVRFTFSTSVSWETNSLALA